MIMIMIPIIIIVGISYLINQYATNNNNNINDDMMNNNSNNNNIETAK